MGEKAKSWRKRLLLLGGSLVFSLLLAEVALRLLNPYLRLDNERPTFVAHETYHHTRRPHAEWFVLREGQPETGKINSRGMPDSREIEMPKPNGVYRVLVLGDSFTEGYVVERTVATHVEAALSASDLPADRARRFEVFNGGISWYSPLIHYVRLKHEWSKLAPDAIVLNIDLTDPYDDYWRYRPRLVVDAAGDPDAVPDTAVGFKRFATPILDVSYIARWLHRLRKRQRPQTGGGDTPMPVADNVFAFHYPGADQDPENEKAMAYCLGNLERSIALCKREGIRLSITTYPHREQLEPDGAGRVWTRWFERRIAALCAREDVPFFSAFDVMVAARRAGKPIYLDGDMHFDPEGQVIWAAAIARFFVSLPRD